MTIDAGRQRAETAEEYHERGEFERAAGAYTAAAYEFMGANAITHRPSAAEGLRYLLVAATCLRYVGRMDRCQNRCWQGVYLAKAVGTKAMERPREPNPYDQSERGVWYEFEADFRVVGRLPDVDAAYDRARAVYVDASDPETGAFEQLHLNAAMLPKLLVYGTDTDPEELHQVLRPMVPTLTDWIEYKRTTLPEIFDRLDNGEEWTFTT